MISCKPESLKSEADVEHKVVIPLLQNILGFNEEEVVPKDYLAPTTLDKGAGKKIGYYPDFAVYIGAIPLIIVEAKDTSVDVKEGYREARLYASELNSRFPKDVNPVKFVFASNGLKVAYSSASTQSDYQEFDLSELREGCRALDTLRASASREKLFQSYQEIANKIRPNKFRSPLSFVGGPSRQNESVGSNTFSTDLIPLMRRYFDPENSINNKDILDNAYCSSDEIQKYNSVLDILLSDRMPNQPSVQRIVTKEGKSETFDSAINDAVYNKNDYPDPLILLLGGVGSGKSTFLERYFNNIPNESRLKHIKYAKVDFNKATEDLESVEEWICEEIINQLKSKYGDQILSNENLDLYFHNEIEVMRNGPLKEIFEIDERYARLEIAKKKQEWFEDKVKLCTAIIRHENHLEGLPFIAIFDNVDRRDRDQQLKIFQTVQWFRNKTSSFSILALRDETYDAFKNQPPLDAFLKPFSFRIHPPRFISVVQKRLDLAINHLSQKSSKKLKYTLPNGAIITYPANHLGSYLVTIYKSIFNRSRKVGAVLEALSGKNIRNALEMFIDILMSGYLEEDLILGITEGEVKTIPEWQILRVLMRGSRKFYSSSEGYVFNVLNHEENFNSSDNFLYMEILEHLSKHRKEKGIYNIEGYIHAKKLVREMSALGYIKEDTLRALEVLLRRSLIQADHQRTKNIKEDDYIKVTASGYYHIRLLMNRGEYLANIAFDTPMSDVDTAKRISEQKDDSRITTDRRRDLFIGYLEEIRNEAFTVFGRTEDNSPGINNTFSQIDRFREFDRKNLEAKEEKKQESH